VIVHSLGVVATTAAKLAKESPSSDQTKPPALATIPAAPMKAFFMANGDHAGLAWSDSTGL